jgi:hypothetical protein
MTMRYVTPCKLCASNGTCTANCAYSRLRGNAEFGAPVLRAEEDIIICNLCADGGCGADCSYARLAAAVAPETFRCDVVVAIERAVAAGVERRIIHDVLRALARQHAAQPEADDHATAAAKLLDRARRPRDTPASIDVPGPQKRRARLSSIRKMEGLVPRPDQLP